jgi:hypothetical protein
MLSSGLDQSFRMFAELSKHMVINFDPINESVGELSSVLFDDIFNPSIIFTGAPSE